MTIHDIGLCEGPQPTHLRLDVCEGCKPANHRNKTNEKVISLTTSHKNSPSKHQKLLLPGGCLFTAISYLGYQSAESAKAYCKWLFVKNAIPDTSWPIINWAKSIADTRAEAHYEELKGYGGMIIIGASLVCSLFAIKMLISKIWNRCYQIENN